MDDVTVLGPEYLIPFKAKAWLDLSERKSKGEQVDSRDVRKHRNDVFRLTDLVNPEKRISVPETVLNDMNRFIEAMRTEQIDLKQLGIVGRKQEDILKELQHMFCFHVIVFRVGILKKRHSTQRTERFPSLVRPSAIRSNILVISFSHP